MSKKYALYELGLYEKAMPNSLSLKEKLATAKKIGFDYVELSIDETDDKLARLDWTAAERREVVEAALDTGIAFRSICLSGHRKYPFGSTDEVVRRRSMDIMQKACDLAATLGIRTIQLAGYDVYYEEGTEKTREMFATNLRKATEMAAASGVILGFETMETPFMNTVEKAMHYVSLVGSPYLGVYPDLGNLTNAAVAKNDSTASLSELVSKDLETGRGHIFAMHLKETVPGKFREIPFGTGHTDFAAGIKKAWELGVRRFVTECWAVDDGWQKEAQKANDMMRALLDKMETSS